MKDVIQILTSFKPYIVIGLDWEMREESLASFHTLGVDVASSARKSTGALYLSPTLSIKLTGFQLIT